MSLPIKCVRLIEKEVKLFQTKEEDLSNADIMKAMSHPERLAILRGLHKARKPIAIKTIWKGLSRPQGIISQHFMYLRRMKIVAYRKQRSKRYYYIISEHVEKILDLLYP